MKSIKIKKALYSRTKWGKIKKPFTDRIASEKAFELQNEYRKSAGSDKIKWSEIYIMFVWKEQSKLVRITAIMDGMKQR